MYAIPFFNPVTCPVDFSVRALSACSSIRDDLSIGFGLSQKVALFYPACTRLPLHTFSYVVPLPGFIASVRLCLPKSVRLLHAVPNLACSLLCRRRVCHSCC